MNFDIIRQPVLFLVLCVAQVFILNHIQLFGCAMPLLYVFFGMSMKKGMAKWSMMVWAFVMGILLDIFANTPGVTAASMTAIAMAQPYVLNLFVSREVEENFIPSMMVMGWKSYTSYTVAMTLGFCIIYFTLEMMSFFNFGKWLGCVIGSAILTAALIVAVDRLVHRKIGN